MYGEAAPQPMGRPRRTSGPTRPHKRGGSSRVRPDVRAVGAYGADRADTAPRRSGHECQQMSRMSAPAEAGISAASRPALASAESPLWFVSNFLRDDSYLPRALDASLDLTKAMSTSLDAATRQGIARAVTEVNECTKDSYAARRRDRAPVMPGDAVHATIAKDTTMATTVCCGCRCGGDHYTVRRVGPVADPSQRCRIHRLNLISTGRSRSSILLYSRGLR
jgi:hypothetical protein